MRQFLSAGLSLLRGVTGDDAYDKYLAHHRQTTPDEEPLGRGLFQGPAGAEVAVRERLLLKAAAVACGSGG